jgi:hypothetical protein
MMWELKTLAVATTAFSISLAATAWFAHSKGVQSGMSKVQNQWDAEVAAMALAQAAELERAMAKTAELQAQVDQIRRSHRNEVNRIVREHSALVDSLRDRPEARAGDGGVPEGADAGITGCTGAGLSRRDAEFLAGLAADAERTQSALRACIAHTAEIERQLNR